jgi:hypothetical protein
VTSCLLRHPLLIALAQLAVGLFGAYFLTERWQRWRQRREFQYRTMAKLSETSMELFVVLGELLSIHPQRMAMADVWDDRQRRYIAQRVAFHAVEAEIMASYRNGKILEKYHSLNDTAKKLFDLVQSSGAITTGQFQPIQDEFLKERKAVLGQMIAEMKALRLVGAPGAPTLVLPRLLQQACGFRLRDKEVNKCRTRHDHESRVGLIHG